MTWTDWLVDRYIAVSSEVERLFTEDAHLPIRKFQLVVNSVDAEVFSSRMSEENYQRMLEKIHIPKGSVIVGTVANLREEKCIDRLIRALPNTLSRVPNAFCLIVGDGVCRTSLEQMVRMLHLEEHVRFVRFWPDIMEVLPLIDIFVLPSAFEGMSIALLEAMAAERAIVATDSPENREVITEGTGILVDTAREDQLSDAIIHLMQDSEQRKRLGIAARERVERCFSLAQSVRQLSDFYKTLTDGVWNQK